MNNNEVRSQDQAPLSGGFNPFEKYSSNQIGSFPQGLKIKNMFQTTTYNYSPTFCNIKPFWKKNPYLTQPVDPEKKSLNFIFPTKYVIPKSLKFSHWLSEIQETPWGTSFWWGVLCLEVGLLNLPFQPAMDLGGMGWGVPPPSVKLPAIKST